MDGKADGCEDGLVTSHPNLGHIYMLKKFQTDE
jgi:hypothetical protein